MSAHIIFVVACAFSFSILFPAIVYAQTDCDIQARTELEVLFCKIQNTNEGRTLPSFLDFRKNSPKIQAALLKAPARRLNLTVPQVAGSAQKPTNKRSLAKQQDVTSSPAVQEKSTQNYSERTNSQQSESSHSLKECRLQRESIDCGRYHYRLATNLTNKYLRPGALDSKNKMQMQTFPSNQSNSTVIQNHLFDAYLHYIEKMLDIGLGASTMSFSKFYYTFYELQKKKENFSERFEKMYDFLKKDKATMAIKSSYTDDKPTSISQCAALNERIIVCDRKEMNWVFVKK